MPAAAGVYAWYVHPAPPGVPSAGCHVVDGSYLVYVRITRGTPALVVRQAVDAMSSAYGVVVPM